MWLVENSMQNQALLERALVPHARVLKTAKILGRLRTATRHLNIMAHDTCLHMMAKTDTMSWQRGWRLNNICRTNMYCVYWVYRVTATLPR